MASELGYQPNRTAISLKTRNSRTVAAIIPDMEDDFFALAVKGIQSRLEEHGYMMILCQSNESAETEQHLIEEVLSFNVCGIVISLARESGAVPLLEDILETTPVVQFDRYDPTTAIPYVSTDDSKGTYKAGRYLYDQGLRSFGYLGLSSDLKNDRERLEGYQQSLAEHNASLSAVDYIDDWGDSFDNSVRLWAEQMDCIVCYNDIIAARVLISLSSHNIKVPDQVSVCGFDNRFFCDWLNPPLTSISRNTFQLGEQAAMRLLQDVDKSKEYAEIPPSDEPTLIIRKSTK
ncbi:MAG: LacI family DNA-binding transcriptional regulator [Cyclobacteriaceae bacterium]